VYFLKSTLTDPRTGIQTVSFYISHVVKENMIIEKWAHYIWVKAYAPPTVVHTHAPRQPYVAPIAPIEDDDALPSVGPRVLLPLLPPPTVRLPPNEATPKRRRIGVKSAPATPE
jgi:hypothetical protein